MIRDARRQIRVDLSAIETRAFRLDEEEDQSCAREREQVNSYSVTEIFAVLEVHSEGSTALIVQIAESTGQFARSLLFVQVLECC